MGAGWGQGSQVERRSSKANAGGCRDGPRNVRSSPEMMGGGRPRRQEMPGAKTPVFSEELVLQLLAEHLSFEQGASSDLVLLGKFRRNPKAKDWKICDPGNYHYLKKKKKKSL